MNMLRHSITGLRGFKSLIDVQPSVQRSLQRGQPVVALESTIITHGMPYPQNLETALEVEQLVRENGATPATIALIDGRLKVGLSEEDMLKLSTKRLEDVIKCSRRDLPYVVSQGLSGGTTVAATTIIAHMLNIDIFATGGVGGVHRDGHLTMDISADLVELGRTPVAVVCAGVKSILDIPRTLEYLETQGVCVATYGSENGYFPDFYTRNSGCKVPYNLSGPAEAARLIEAVHQLQLKSGILIGVPIPEAYAADKQQIATAIDQAYTQAQQKGISGKQVTPFLLAAIAKITQGNSLQANMALIKNNATVAAQIAQELSRVRCNKNFVNIYANKPKKFLNAPLVIGASILDLSLTMLDELPASLDGATYMTKAKQSAGGVGRNLAEGIFKLHGQANFLSAVGNDEMGKSLLQLMPTALQKGVKVEANAATSLCSVIFDKMGDCKLILGNMEIHEKIAPQRVLEQEELLKNAPLIVMDGNLPLQTMQCVLELAQRHKRPVFFEPTDMRISGKPFTLPRQLTQQIKIISPNFYELRAIVAAIMKRPVPMDGRNIMPENTDLLIATTNDMVKEIQEHFDCVLITLGHHGVLLSCRAAAWNTPCFAMPSGDYSVPHSGEHVMRFYAAPSVDRITNVSGAGDSFSSGFICGLLRGYTLDHSVAMGFIAAERALQSESAVPAEYFSDINEESSILDGALKNLSKLDIN